jgi:MSHA biogenesis protein MshP
MRPPAKLMRGFAIVSAIFILVVLGALGAFIVNVSTNQQIGSALDVQGVRAYQAARAGVEWGIYRVQATPAYNFSYGTPAVAVGSANPNTRLCPASPSSFVPAAPTLAGFTVTVTCTATYDPSPMQPPPASCDPASGIYAPAKCGPTVYRIVSTACWGPATVACPNPAPVPGSLYVERQLEVAF